ncbi:SDR family NAD(P)-dependent oxidoreductase [Chitinophaga silvatica]|uniref:SDR family NAD(P)-dependent oxidoreductase n=1 Tax=Chitinophaga silvatica TaxID=2282649 RepID=A0A3E1Y7E2_9BACT|nr:SDR family oxidoreductase [Chitinophaga silvatica]RFS20663.1 SDR family NAD(P)-dependent oxidoreductase [Chitinophaga silvatica]
MPGKFENKKVVIAGGSTGIGLATAHLLHDAGAQVIITGRSAEKLQQAKSAIPGITTVVLDSNNRNDLDQFFAGVGPFDHLVLTLSGGKGAGEFSSLPLQDLRTGFEGKFWPLLNTLQAAIPYINKSGSATLITAASAAMKAPGVSGLAAINGSLELMIPSIAKELQPVRINAVSPGVIDTSWWDFLSPADKAAAFQQYASQIPMGRVGRPEEVADAILFLIGNTYMTGTVIRCDGGISL